MNIAEKITEMRIQLETQTGKKATKVKLGHIAYVHFRNEMCAYLDTDYIAEPSKYDGLIVEEDPHSEYSIVVL